MENQLVIIVKESGLEETKAQYILEKFQDYFKLAAEWEIKAKSIIVTNEHQIPEMKMAKVGRLFLRDKRIEVENARKKLKEQALREGKAIDGIANVLKALIVPIEEYLERQEKFVEIKQKEKEEAERIAVEKKIEEERIAKEKAEAEERERIKIENEKLKKEAEEREKELKKQKEEAEKERRQQKEEVEKKAFEIAKLIDEAIERKEEKEKIEKELQEKKDAEVKIYEEKERMLKEGNDCEKFSYLADILDNIKFPNVITENAKKKLNEVKELIFQAIIILKKKEG